MIGQRNAVGSNDDIASIRMRAVKADMVRPSGGQNSGRTSASNTRERDHALRPIVNARTIDQRYARIQRARARPASHALDGDEASRGGDRAAIDPNTKAGIPGGRRRSVN